MHIGKRVVLDITKHDAEIIPSHLYLVVSRPGKAPSGASGLIRWGRRSSTTQRPRSIDPVRGDVAGIGSGREVRGGWCGSKPYPRHAVGPKCVYTTT